MKKNITYPDFFSKVCMFTIVAPRSMLILFLCNPNNKRRLTKKSTGYKHTPHTTHYNQRNTGGKKKTGTQTQHTQQDKPLPPYHQRLCPPSPWRHPPWTRIAAPRLPMSLLEAPGARARAHRRIE